MRAFSETQLPRIALFALCLAGCAETGMEPPAVETIPAPEYAALSVGESHVCALDVDGRAFCWGGNEFGQLGDGSTTDRETPAPVEVDYRFDVIDAGTTRTCGLTTEAELVCWGGGFGDSHPVRTLPVPVGPVETRWASLGVGFSGFCAVDVDGRAFCAEDGATMVEVPLGLRWASVAVGGGHACGVTTTGDGYCWGGNWEHQLGYEGAPYHTSDPVLAPGGHQWHELVAGTGYTCGLSTTDTTFCWGVAEHMALGTDTIPEPDVWIGVAEPVAIAGGGLSVRELAPAVTHYGSLRRLATCGLADFSGRQTAVCWGDGQNLTNIGFGRVDWQAVELGSDRGCGLTTDGRILCWAPIVVELAPFDRIAALVHPAIELLEIPSPVREWRDS